MNLAKRQLKKSPAHGSQARLVKQMHGSLEARDENTRQNYPLKKSKDKPVKQPSTAMLRPTNEPKKQPVLSACQTNGRRSAANVREVEFSLVDPQNSGYRDLYFNTLNEKQLQNAKGIGKSFSQKQFGSEQEDRPRTLQDETAVMNSNSTQSILYVGAGNSKVLKCHYHPIKDARYLVELNNDEDILCCAECGPNLMAKGLQLQQISSLKSKRNYELDEFLQRSLQCIETLRKCLSNLPEYQRQLTNQITNEINIHDGYYQHLIELIQQKRDESQSVLIKSLNGVTQYFSGFHQELHQRLGDLETAYNQIIVNREEIKKMAEIDFQKILACESSRLSIPKMLTAPQLEVWKVEIGDYSQFEKDLQNYIVKIEEAPIEKHSHGTSLQSVIESSERRSRSQQESALLCEEQFEWGYKPPKPPAKDIYFSFEKKNSEESVGSPAFKQL